MVKGIRLSTKLIALGVFALIVSAVLFAGFYTYSGKGRLNGIEANKKIREGEITTIVDVRSDLEWNLGHYPSAVHIPITEFDESNHKIQQLTSQSSGGILVYCNTGQRARRGAELLRSYGTRVPVYYLVDSYQTLK